MSEEKKRVSPFETRLATKDDLDACVELVHQIPLENDWEYFPPTSDSKVRAQLEKLIENKTLLVYDNNGVIVGVLGLVIDSFWWTDETTMLDVVFYIKKEFRSFNAFNRMLSVAEEFAKINGLPLSLLFFTTKDVERKFKMLKKRGYESIGFWVTKKRE
jgi:hypothetical protein